MDSIENKLHDLHTDVSRRDAVVFRMQLHELARRGLYDAELATAPKCTPWRQSARRAAMWHATAPTACPNPLIRVLSKGRSVACAPPSQVRRSPTRPSGTPPANASKSPKMGSGIGREV